MISITARKFTKCVVLYLAQKAKVLYIGKCGAVIWSRAQA